MIAHRLRAVKMDTLHHLGEADESAREIVGYLDLAIGAARLAAEPGTGRIEAKVAAAVASAARLKS